MRFNYGSIAALMGAMLILSIAFAVLNISAAHSAVLPGGFKGPGENAQGDGRQRLLSDREAVPWEHL